MERYDGKTKKDDYKKYALIGLGVVLVIVLYNVLVGVIKKVSHPTPDITVVIASTKILDYAMEDEAEALMKPMISDLDGNGKTVVEVIGLSLAGNEGTAAIQQYGVDVETDATKLDSYVQNGTYHCFLLSDTTYCREDYCRALPEDLAMKTNGYCVEIPGENVFEETKMSLVRFYGCIQKDATEEEYEAMVELLRQLKAA